MKERDMLNWTLELAARLGWAAKHVAAPMRAARSGGFVADTRGKGLPDLFLLHERPARMVVAEVKGDGGRATLEQREFLRLVNLISDDTAPTHRAVRAYLWCPDDREAVETILRSKVLM